jgi:8-oxo-dGTP diphosphatase
MPSGADDAKSARPFGENNLPKPLVFDHAQILRDYFAFKRTGQRPKP